MTESETGSSVVSPRRATKFSSRTNHDTLVCFFLCFSSFLLFLRAGGERRRMLRRVHRAVQGVGRGATAAVPPRVPQGVRRPVAAGTPHLPHVQDGHPQALRIRRMYFFFF